MEDLKVINRRLMELHGKYLDGQPLFRVVWSEDQFEKRKTKFSPEGFELPNEVVIEVRKYGQYIHNKYLMERLIEVPEILHNEVLNKLSYEPVWVFEDKDGNSLPPVWGVIEIVINAINNKARGEKLKGPGGSPEEREEELKDMMETLYGNETPVGDALAHKTGIIVPGGQNVN